jgi:hypothetical protein
MYDKHAAVAAAAADCITAGFGDVLIAFNAHGFEVRP